MALIGSDVVEVLRPLPNTPICSCGRVVLAVRGSLFLACGVLDRLRPRLGCASVGRSADPSGLVVAATGRILVVWHVRLLWSLGFWIYPGRSWGFLKL
jgi:hypothetical protein